MSKYNPIKWMFKFYLAMTGGKINEYGSYDGKAEFAVALTVIHCIYIIARLSMGTVQANDPGKCHVKSIGDVMITPFYFVGCNIGKDRFDIDLNGK